MSTFPAIFDTNILSNFLMDGWWDNTNSHRTVLASIMKRGNIKAGDTGLQLVWNVVVKKSSASVYTPGQEVEVTQKDNNIQCTLPWASLTANDAITKEELRLAASNGSVLYSRREQMIEKLRTDFEDDLNSRFINGDYNVTSGTIAGFESFMADGNAAGAADNDETPADSYAGFTTAPSGIAGAVSDAWSPKLVNYKSTGLGSGATWATNGLAALTYAKDQLTFGQREGDMPDLVIMTKTMLSQLKDLIRASQRIVVVDGAADPSGLGFKGAVVHDGIEILPDVDVSSGVAYMLNTRKLFLHVVADPAAVSGAGDASVRSKKGKLFELSSGYDLKTNMHMFRLDMLAQLRTNPRFHGKLAAFS